MKKIKNLEISNISRESIYKVYRNKTLPVRNKIENRKKQLVSRRIRTH